MLSRFKQFRPQVENLEDRRLLAAYVKPAVDSTGNIQIVGKAGDYHDTVYVDDLTKNGVQGYEIKHFFRQDGGLMKLKKTFIPLSKVSGDRIVYQAGAGNDTFEYKSSYGKVLKVEAYGGTGNDTLKGFRGRDSIYGESGEDHIFGYCGNAPDQAADQSDLLVGGEDNDPLDGKDVIRGGRGNDTLMGGNGPDQLYGEANNDLLVAGNDDCPDVLFGGKGGVDRFRLEIFTDTMADYESGIDEPPDFYM